MKIGHSTSVSPKFGGVIIENSPSKLSFKIVPDTLVKGVQYNGQTKQSAFADQLTEEMLAIGKSDPSGIVDAFFGEPRQWNIPEKLSASLQQLVDDAPIFFIKKRALKNLVDRMAKAQFFTPSSSIVSGGQLDKPYGDELEIAGYPARLSKKV